jgi:hypothetical protein
LEELLRRHEMGQAKNARELFGRGGQEYRTLPRPMDTVQAEGETRCRVSFVLDIRDG